MIALKTVKIISKGRKYYTCEVGSSKAKLLINPVSEGLKPGDGETFLVLDQSERTKYGATLIFEPLEKATPENLSKLKQKVSAERWVKYAEEDVAAGRFSSRAINTAMEVAQGIPHLADRLAKIQEQAAKNKQKYMEQQQAQAKAWEEARMAGDKKAQDKAPRLRVLFAESQLPPLNKPIKWQGKIVVFDGYGQPFKINESHPSIFGGHLLGYEGRLGRYAYYRPATEQEQQEYEARQEALAQAEAARKAKEDTIKRISTYIQERGERPEGMNAPDGQVVLDRQTPYGGGEWFIIGKSYIWYVKNNGADGDDWSQNNIMTGGAGAIGWRIPYDQEIAETLFPLNETTQ